MKPRKIMMHKLLAAFISAVCGFSVALMIGNLFSMAVNRIKTTETIAATIQLDPSNIPRAGQASLTKFVLTQSEGQTVPPANCDCQIAIYNENNQLVMRDLPLSAIQSAGQQSISTIITFPTPGAYRLVLTGQSYNGSFAPFVLNFPVTVNT